MPFTDQQIIDLTEELERHKKLVTKVGLILHEFRMEQGLSQREAAHQLGTSQSKISDLEKGDCDPKLSSLLRYAHGYGYKIDITFRKVN